MCKYHGSVKEAGGSIYHAQNEIEEERAKNQRRDVSNGSLMEHGGREGGRGHVVSK